MATGTIYLRPCADVSLGHTVYPTTLGAGYLAINEEIADDSTTYIEASGSGVHTSSFRFAIEKGVKITKVNSCDIMMRHTTSDSSLTIGVEFLINGVICLTRGTMDDAVGNYFATNTDGWETFGILKSNNAADTSKHQDVINKINEQLALDGGESFPEVVLRFCSKSLSDATDKNSATYHRVSQIYCELNCEYETPGLNIHTKQNGAWKQAQKAFQKKSGAWVEITEEECMDIMQSNLIVSGGM